MNSAIFVRIIIAIFLFFFLGVLIPLMFEVVKFPLTGNFLTLVHLCIIGFCFCYAIWGRPVSM